MQALKYFIFQNNFFIKLDNKTLTVFLFSNFDINCILLNIINFIFLIIANLNLNFCYFSFIYHFYNILFQ